MTVRIPVTMSTCFLDSRNGVIVTACVVLVSTTVISALVNSIVSSRRRHNTSDNAEHLPLVAAPRRFGGAIRLKRERYRRYRELHDAVWPQVLQRMHESNIRNFSIYYHSETGTMFQTFEWVGHLRYYQEYGRMVDKNEEKKLFDTDMEDIANDEVTRRWWKECESCQDPFSQWKPGSRLLSDGGGGDWWAPLECVNHCGYWPVGYSKTSQDPDFVKLKRKRS